MKQTTKEGIMDNIPSLDRTTTLIAGTTFTVASLVSYGDTTIETLGFNITDMLTGAVGTVAGIEVTFASIVALASLLAVYIGNNADLTDLSNHQTAIGIATFITVFATMISPDLVTWLEEETVRAGGFFVLQLIGFTATAEAVEWQDRYGHLGGN